MNLGLPDAACKAAVYSPKSHYSVLLKRFRARIVSFFPLGGTNQGTQNPSGTGEKKAVLFGSDAELEAGCYESFWQAAKIGKDGSGGMPAER
jgi:hypothetical protein